MFNKRARTIFIALVLSSLAFLPAQEKNSGFLDKFTIKAPGQFNGYTNYWHSLFWEWRQYGSLFQLSVPDVARTIAQSKLDTAEELGIPGLLMQEGFLAALLEATVQGRNDPTADEGREGAR